MGSMYFGLGAPGLGFVACLISLSYVDIVPYGSPSLPSPAAADAPAAAAAAMLLLLLQWLLSRRMAGKLSQHGEEARIDEEKMDRCTWGCKRGPGLEAAAGRCTERQLVSNRSRLFGRLSSLHLESRWSSSHRDPCAIFSLAVTSERECVCVRNGPHSTIIKEPRDSKQRRGSKEEAARE